MVKVYRAKVTRVGWVQTARQPVAVVRLPLGRLLVLGLVVTAEQVRLQALRVVQSLGPVVVVVRAIRRDQLAVLVAVETVGRQHQQMAPLVV